MSRLRSQLVRHSPALLLLWAAVALALLVWSWVGVCGWDTGVYVAAMRALRAGQDPYLAAIAIQKSVHDAAQVAGQALGQADPPYSYVYSPVTLPLLRLLALPPVRLVGGFYWLLYLAAALVPLWLFVRAAKESESSLMGFAAPVTLFFPGLLASGVVMSGNVAYILYAAILLAWWRGHRTERWGIFYCAVLVASCFKAPMLCMVLLGPFVSRSASRWKWALLTIAAGVSAFAAQRLVWPQLFQHFLQAVDLQFQYNHDFGWSPAGMLCEWTYRAGVPYSPAGLFYYAAYAVPIFFALIKLSSQYRKSLLSWQDWMPVLLVGVVLLNPRLIEYDAGPIALPLLLIGQRQINAGRRATSSVILWWSGFVLINVISLFSWEMRKVLDSVLVPALFAMGALHLRNKAGAQRRARGVEADSYVPALP